MIFLYQINSIDDDINKLETTINEIEEEIKNQKITSKEEIVFEENNKEKEEIKNMVSDRGMKVASFKVVIGLMSIEIIFIFIIFFLVGVGYLKFSDNNLNIFIGATIAQITAIFFFIIKHLFPLNK